MPKTTKQNELLSVPEVAKRLGVSHDTVGRWCRSGIVFPNVVLKNPFGMRSRFLVPVADVDAVMKVLNEKPSD
jgi:predicted DNA-binding transcriptional regulator AlpA